MPGPLSSLKKAILPLRLSEKGADIPAFFCSYSVNPVLISSEPLGGIRLDLQPAASSRGFFLERRNEMM
jgi:hypothetical protein